MKIKKQILAYKVVHTDSEKKYFKWNWSMIWLLIKYKVLWGMEISFTVTKAIDREEYFIQFFAE
jgi:hypothetical protein